MGVVGGHLPDHTRLLSNGNSENMLYYKIKISPNFLPNITFAILLGTGFILIFNNNTIKPSETNICI